MTIFSARGRAGGRPAPFRLVARLTIATVAAMVVALAGCTNANLLPTLRDEPILAQPPGATELARTEIEGSTFGFPTPARVEAIWGIQDETAVADWYLAEVGQLYDLWVNKEDQWVGGRRSDDVGVNVGLTIYSELSEVSWGSQVAESEDVEAWSGPVVITSASAD